MRNEGLRTRYWVTPVWCEALDLGIDTWGTGFQRLMELGIDGTGVPCDGLKCILARVVGGRKLRIESHGGDWTLTAM